MGDLPVVLRLGGGQVLLRGAATVTAWRLMDAGMRASVTANGWAAPRPVLDLLDALRAEADAAMSVNGRADVRGVAPLPVSTSTEMVDVEETAKMLAVSTRQARRLARDMSGRKVAGRWVFDRAAVAAAVLERRPGGDLDVHVRRSA